MRRIGRLRLRSSLEIAASRVSIGFECVERGVIKPEKCYDLLGASGVKHARCQTGWAVCEKEKGVYDFSWLDDIVDNLLCRGVQPWFNVGYGNPVYMENASNPTAVGCVPLLYGEAVMQAWLAYVRALARHFQGRVCYFEIWNEPDIPAFWYPGEPDAGQYARLVEATGAVIRQIIPDAKIGASYAKRWWSPYLGDFAREIAPGALDFLCFHAYTMTPEAHFLEDVQGIRDAFEMQGKTGIGLWQGESGYPSYFPPNHWLHPKGQGSERQQAVWQLRRFLLDCASGTEMTSFFQAADMMERPYAMARSVTGPYKVARHGILNGLTYTPKKSYDTIRCLSVLLSGEVRPLAHAFTLSYAESAHADLTAVKLPLEINGNAVYTYFLPTDIEAEAGMERAAVLGLKNAEALKRPMLVDPFLNEAYLLETEDICRTGERTLYRRLPIGEYPVLLCERGALEIEE